MGDVLGDVVVDVVGDVVVVGSALLTDGDVSTDVCCDTAPVRTSGPSVAHAATDMPAAKSTATIRLDATITDGAPRRRWLQSGEP